jgi:hypothetical protein
MPCKENVFGRRPTMLPSKGISTRSISKAI